MSNEKINATTTRNFAKSAKQNQQLSDTELKGFYIKKLKTGLYYYLYYTTISGKRRTLSIGHYPSLTPEQARTIGKGYMGRIATGEDVQATIQAEKEQFKKNDKLTVQAYLDEIYKVTLKRKKSGLLTKQAIEKHFKRWMNIAIYDIEGKHVHQWHIEMEKKELSFERINGVYKMFKTMLNHAVNNGYIDSHQLTKIKLEKPQLSQFEIDSSNSRTYLSHDQVLQFFSGIEKYQAEKRERRQNSRLHGKAYLQDLNEVEYVDHVKPWLLTMFYTGFRPGDIFGLRWEHISFQLETIRKTIEKTAHHHPEPKTFPITKPLVEILKKWQQQNGSPQEGYVFINKNTQKRFGKEAMQKPWKKIRILAKLPVELHLYTLRHNFASHLIMNGADLLSVSKLLAHEDIQTTINHYAHLQPNLKRDIVDQFSNSFKVK